MSTIYTVRVKIFFEKTEFCLCIWDLH